MKDKFERKVERQLKKSAKKIKPRNFSEIWGEIGDKIAPDKPAKKRPFLQIVLGAVAFCLVLSIIPLSIINYRYHFADNYQYSQLKEKTVEKAEFYSRLSEAGINHIDFNDYEIFVYILYYVDDNKVKGGGLDIKYEGKDFAFLAKIKFYDKTIILRDAVQYATSYNVNGAKINYIKTLDGENFTYDINANYKKANYLIKLTTDTEDIESILQLLFGN